MSFIARIHFWRISVYSVIARYCTSSGVAIHKTRRSRSFFRTPRILEHTEQTALESTNLDSS
ncbi:hypothetical protein F4V45_03420 [Helicobacter canis]|uniref:Uncharacterized protein n=1 Tax=Helicobacter canis TaxID=29419 RepID=A0A5M9QSM6_9HELI|nr:hypothetical protein [Helicobacter canis]KAA8710035.1 hypothetical protein F4V45_03420 [Helicobacter canis]